MTMPIEPNTEPADSGRARPDLRRSRRQPGALDAASLPRPPARRRQRDPVHPDHRLRRHARPGIGPWTGWWIWNHEQLLPPVNGGKPTLTLFPFSLGEHPFGQNTVGKDYFAMVMRGIVNSSYIMFIIGIIGAFIGVVVGAIAGYYRGWVDAVLMRITDIVIVIPIIVIGAVVGSAAGGLGPVALAIFLGFFAWTAIARLVRSEFLSLREREFVEAARVAGASDLRIIFKHILPNAIGVVIVSTTLLIAVGHHPRDVAVVPRLRRQAAGGLAGSAHLRERVGVPDAAVAVLVAGGVHRRPVAAGELRRRRPARRVRPASEARQDQEGQGPARRRDRRLGHDRRTCPRARSWRRTVRRPARASHRMCRWTPCSARRAMPRTRRDLGTRSRRRDERPERRDGQDDLDRHPGEVPVTGDRGLVGDADLDLPGVQARCASSRG